MTEPLSLNPLLPTPQMDSMFPTLTPAQVARIEADGSTRPIQAGEVLYEVGDQIVPLFVVKTGQPVIVRPTATTETLVTTLGPGQFTGEVNMLSGRPSNAMPLV